jgi:hypothetical protein
MIDVKDGKSVDKVSHSSEASVPPIIISYVPDCLYLPCNDDKRNPTSTTLSSNYQVLKVLYDLVPTLVSLGSNLRIILKGNHEMKVPKDKGFH